MIIRQILLSTQPPQMVTLYFDSRSNAEQVAQVAGDHSLFEDDYGQTLDCITSFILSDLITDMNERFRAEGEMQCSKMHAEIKFEERVDRDAVLKSLANKKKAAAMAQSMPRVQMPPGMQS